MVDLDTTSRGDMKASITQMQLSKLVLISSVSSILCVALLLIINALNYEAFAKDSLTTTHGVASSDVTDDSAIIWARANNNSQMHVMYDTDPGYKNPTIVNATSMVNVTTDYTSMARLQHL